MAQVETTHMHVTFTGELHELITYLEEQIGFGSIHRTDPVKATFKIAPVLDDYEPIS